MASVCHDFDRIALACSAADDVPHPYDRMLMSLVPADCRRLLDLGCGSGRLARALASRLEAVTAVDLSPEMIRIARERSTAHGNITFVVGDVLNLPTTIGLFDCVVSVNVLHHLPAEQAAAAMKAAVAPGGLLIIHDVRRSSGLFDRVLDVPRIAVKAAWRIRRISRVRGWFRQRSAWAQHARADAIATADEIRRIAAHLFEGSVLHQHFLWRYTLVWRR